MSDLSTDIPASLARGCDNLPTARTTQPPSQWRRSRFKVPVQAGTLPLLAPTLDEGRRFPPLMQILHGTCFCGISIFLFSLSSNLHHSIKLNGWIFRRPWHRRRRKCNRSPIHSPFLKVRFSKSCSLLFFQRRRKCNLYFCPFSVICVTEKWCPDR